MDPDRREGNMMSQPKAMPDPGIMTHAESSDRSK